MANKLKREKQVAAISALAEGSSIRSIERMTGIHRDTVMRLGVRVGKGCTRILDRMLHNLTCKHLQIDEIWGFVRKKVESGGRDLNINYSLQKVLPASEKMPEACGKHRFIAAQ